MIGSDGHLFANFVGLASKFLQSWFLLFAYLICYCYRFNSWELFVQFWMWLWILHITSTHFLRCCSLSHAGSKLISECWPIFVWELWTKKETSEKFDCSKIFHSNIPSLEEIANLFTKSETNESFRSLQWQSLFHFYMMAFLTLTGISF